MKINVQHIKFPMRASENSRCNCITLKNVVRLDISKKLIITILSKQYNTVCTQFRYLISII